MNTQSSETGSEVKSRPDKGRQKRSGKRIKPRVSDEKRRLLGALIPIILLVAAIAVFSVIRSLSGTKPSLVMNGVMITLPEGYEYAYRDRDSASYKYTGSDINPGRVVINAAIRGYNAQIFASAEEVTESSEWLEGLEIYENAHGMRMARGYNLEKPQQPDRRYYVEGENSVFLINMIEDPRYYDTDACEQVMLAIADSLRYTETAGMTPEKRLKNLQDETIEQIVARMTPEQKALQMVQPACYNITSADMRSRDYGSILSQQSAYSAKYWVEMTDRFQREALLSPAGIPYIYGEDSVHGVNYCLNAVIFPHNIGIGAANDGQLTYLMGKAVANEALLCHLPWNFAPCTAVSGDIRWGRTYESYGSDPALITRLASAYTKGLVDGGVVACVKHFMGDGDVRYGTGEAGKLIDRGDAQLSEEEIETRMNVYRQLIENGAQTIMISHSSLNGTKMHENGEYILRLKEETGFRGFVVSDWEAVQNIPAASYAEQVTLAVNNGIDMLMEVSSFEEAANIIVRGMDDGSIPVSRVDDAVTRILYVKRQAGLFTDPFFEKRLLEQQEVGSAEYRALAEQLVEKSLVLLKNDHDLLPLKKGMTVYVTGPAADNASVQCGGWTLDWNGSAGEIPGVTTVLQGLKEVCEAHGIHIITDPALSDAADAVILCVGERPYAEWLGDTPDPSLYGTAALAGNKDAVQWAAACGKPVITLIFAGRQVLLNDEDLARWNSAVMCYLPGSEGAGIARVLTGDAPFTGKLPSPWYADVSQFGTGNCRWPAGYGLEYHSKGSPEE